MTSLTWKDIAEHEVVKYSREECGISLNIVYRVWISLSYCYPSCEYPGACNRNVHFSAYYPAPAKLYLFSWIA